MDIHLISFVKHRFIDAILRPEKPRYAVHSIRTILRTPRLFQICSLFLQLRDVARARNARSAAPWTEYKRRVCDYNAGETATKLVTRTRRMEELYGVVQVVKKDLSSLRLLSIGPRTVHELFMAWLYGFTWRNIEAIDLYSTNPKILVMDNDRHIQRQCRPPRGASGGWPPSAALHPAHLSFEDAAAFRVLPPSRNSETMWKSSPPGRRRRP